MHVIKKLFLLINISINVLMIYYFSTKMTFPESRLFTFEKKFMIIIMLFRQISIMAAFSPASGHKLYCMSLFQLCTIVFEVSNIYENIVTY